jgi:hypothetical protein
MSAVLYEGQHSAAQGRTGQQTHRPVSASVSRMRQFRALALYVNTQFVRIYPVILL